jgi:hypothetical protein
MAFILIFRDHPSRKFTSRSSRYILRRAFAYRYLMNCVSTTIREIRFVHVSLIRTSSLIFLEKVVRVRALRSTHSGDDGIVAYAAAHAQHRTISIALPGHSEDIADSPGDRLEGDRRRPLSVPALGVTLKSETHFDSPNGLFETDRHPVSSFR